MTDNFRIYRSVHKLDGVEHIQYFQNENMPLARSHAAHMVGGLGEVQSVAFYRWGSLADLNQLND